MCNTAHTSTTFSADKTKWDAIFTENFTGATSSANGKAGGVPKPLAGQEGFALFGDGTWKDPPLSRLYATSKVLWTGNVWNTPTTITLTDNMNNYNYIIVYLINSIDMATSTGIFRPSIDTGVCTMYKNSSGIEFMGYVEVTGNTTLLLNDMVGLSSSGNHIGRVEGIKFEQGNGNPIQDWVANTAYVVGNLVVYNNLIYQCTTANNDSTFNSANWKVIGGGTSINDWVTAKSYAVGDFVKYNNVIYVCNTAHTSTTFTADKSKWDSIKVEDMVGATSSTNGKSGGVPAPTTTDIGKYLRGDGTWDVPVSGALNIINEELWTNTSGTPIAVGDTLSFTHNINDYDYIVLMKGTGGYGTTVVTPDVFDGNRTMIMPSISGNNNYALSLLTSSSGTSCSVSYIDGTGSLSRIIGWKLVNPYDYSTSEKRIGTWINGKALYQKTFTGYTIATGSGGTNLNMYNISSLGIDKVISLDACAHQGNESYFGEWTELSTDYIAYGVNSTNTYIRCKHSGFGGYEVRVTIRYTKT